MEDPKQNAGDSAARPQARWWAGYPFAVLVLLIALGLVVGVWKDWRERELAQAREQFGQHAGRIADLIQQRLDEYELTLRGGAAMVAAVQWPAPAHWHSYVSGLSLATRYPAVLGLGFAAYVDPAGLARLQLLMRDAGAGHYTVRPPGVRPAYGPIVYLEPATADNRQTIGYDMYSEPVRRAAMLAALESGRTRLSGMVYLLQDHGRRIPGLLLYHPVYAGDLPPQTVAARRAAMKGWVYLPFRVHTMVQAATAGARGSERLRIVDVSDAAPQVLYEDPGIDTDNAFALSLPLEVDGRRWRLDFYSGPAASAVPGLASLNWLLAAGIAISLLLFAIVWSLAGTQARAQRIASAMTASLRRSEERFRTAIQHSPIGKALLDAQGRVLEVNDAFERLVGRPAAQLLGHPLAGVLAGADPHSREAALQALAAGTVARATVALRRADGDLRHVQLVAAPLPGRGEGEAAQLVQVDDITERVRAEQEVQALNRSLEARVAARTRALREANRELESFAYSVSHDLRAPLRSIEGFSRILLEKQAAALDATGRDYLQRVRNATARMGELIEALLKLSRIGRGELKPEEVDLSALAADVVAGLRESRPGHAPEVAIQPGLRAQGDRALLRNLLDNLIGNAWKFTRDAAAPRIAFGAEYGPDGLPEFFVRDNGAGFDPAYADKLFQPFQRLHSQDQFEGHGIGLASVKRIVERHGGHLRAEGAPGQGATFFFTLAPDPHDAH